MLIKIRNGTFDPDQDLEPIGREVWVGGDDELPAAVLTAMGANVEPGTWYEFENFSVLIEALAPVEEQQDVRSTVDAYQSGVSEPWVATIEIGQSAAALMICQSVVALAKRLQEQEKLWIRVD